MNLKHFLTPLSLSIVLIGLLVGLAAAAPNAINNWCATDPPGNNACSTPISNTPSWKNPGYRWHVFYDVGFGNTMCVRSRASSSDNWSDFIACQFVGDNPTWEDCGDNNPPNCRDDHWLCETNTNFTNASAAQFEFSARQGSGCSGNQNDTSGAQNFSTGPNTVTLRTLEARAQRPLLPGMAALGVVAAFVGGFVLRRRHHA